jgi:hypothetical protein
MRPLLAIAMRGASARIVRSFKALVESAPA